VITSSFGAKEHHDVRESGDRSRADGQARAAARRGPAPSAPAEGVSRQDEPRPRELPAANIPLDDIIQPTEVPNLSVVLSGPIPPNPSELLASDLMKHLIEEMRGKFAYVIFDSPPVLAVTDAIVLAASADGVVLCVHGGKTPRDLVQRSAERLRQSNIPVLGAILNNLDLHQYGYTYRKSYYDYYEAADDDKQRKTV
jgi:Mrp family chromosome partitioning ATPase